MVNLLAELNLRDVVLSTVKTLPVDEPVLELRVVVQIERPKPIWSKPLKLIVEPDEVVESVTVAPCIL